MPAARLRGRRVALRPLEAADVPRLVEIAGEPEVARWWPGISKEDLRRITGPGDVLAFAIELQGELIGLAQVGEELDPDYRHANVDLFSERPGTGGALARTPCGR